ncbi:MAG: hydrolase [Oscillospiraceae bacterium]|nr:hydrolase [Oscillospiraceae bacterium]
MKTYPTPVEGVLRKAALKVPAVIRESSGIVVFNKRIKSLVFTTDVSVIRNVNADAVIAVYPFTPQPVITQALLTAADIPLFVGVGGGLTKGQRVVNLAMYAEMQGAMGVVVNAPTPNEVIEKIAAAVDIPVVATVVREDTDVQARAAAGVSIFNVSAAARTPQVVAAIRAQLPSVPIIATGGPADRTIAETIRAGANAITWTPPSCGEIFRGIMDNYRAGRAYEELHG